MATDVLVATKGIQIKQRLSRYAVLISVALMALKFWAWMSSHSLAIFSDALNSMLDIFAYSALAISIRIQDLAPDDEHPFGHRRAEPLASMLISVFAIILGFNLVKDGVLGLMSPVELSPAPVALVIMIIAIITKVGMVISYRWAWKQTCSTALHASLVDSRNDVLASSVALLGFLVGGLWDIIAALVIGAWIIISGVRIGKTNLDYLMGRSPSPDVLQNLRNEALSVPGVEGTNDLRAHYVGDKLHVELHAEVSELIDIQTGHAIEITLRDRLEQLPDVGRAFIHLDPVEKKVATALGATR